MVLALYHNFNALLCRVSCRVRFTKNKKRTNRTSINLLPTYKYKKVTTEKNLEFFFSIEKVSIILYIVFMIMTLFINIEL